MVILTNSINLSSENRMVYSDDQSSNIHHSVLTCQNAVDLSGISLVMNKGENDTESIFPLPLEAYNSSEIIKKDTQDENAIPGVCGLNNIGNTCFINSALQCLFATTYLKEFICHGDLLTNDDYSHESSTLLLFIERFQEMFTKYFNGQYSILYPEDFHFSLSRLMPIFGDKKQHDSQEFVSFVLNTLHEFINQASNKSKIKESLTQISLHSPQHSNIDDSKRLKIDDSYVVENNVQSENEAGVDCEENTSKADTTWREYTGKNQSIIIDHFQGQFQSVITCDKCAFVSITYEPFMFLSLPIPHAMDQQFVIHWVASSTFSNPGMINSKRYLVTVNKNGFVSDIRKSLLSMLKTQDIHINTNNVLIAETKRSSHINILDDRTKLSFISKEKTLYAIEVVKDSILSDDLKEESINEEKPNAKCETDEMNDNRHDENAVSAWHSCSICLDETFDEDLKIHRICGGFLCKECLKKMADVNEGLSFSCPVCNRFISSNDYENYVEDAKVQKKPIRQVLVPIMFRKLNEKSDNEKKKFSMFGHPYIISVPSQVSRLLLILSVHQISPIFSKNMKLLQKYEIVMTDGSGLSCGICDILSSCTGCSITGFENIQLKPGLCITVHFEELPPSMLNQLNSSTDDTSMSSLRASDTVSLDECIEKFGDIEYLGDSNPWFCPKCNRHQTSSKHLSITKWPDILIVHLKRFYFEGQQGCKITCPVSFPLSNLQVNTIACVHSNSEKMIKTSYNLYGCICHTGTLYGGHYTAFTRTSLANEWYYFNDETYQKMSPNEEQYSDGYVLFYQK